MATSIVSEHKQTSEKPCSGLAVVAYVAAFAAVVFGLPFVGERSLFSTEEPIVSRALTANKITQKLRDAKITRFYRHGGLAGDGVVVEAENSRNVFGSDYKSNKHYRVTVSPDGVRYYGTAPKSDETCDEFIAQILVDAAWAIEAVKIEREREQAVSASWKPYK